MTDTDETPRDESELDGTDIIFPGEDPDESESDDSEPAPSDPEPDPDS